MRSLSLSLSLSLCVTPSLFLPPPRAVSSLSLPISPHTHTRVDNKRVCTRRRWSTSPCLNVFMHTERRGEGSVSLRASENAAARTRGETSTTTTTNVTSWNISRIYRAASFQGHAIKMRGQEPGTPATRPQRQTFACPYQLPV